MLRQTLLVVSAVAAALATGCAPPSVEPHRACRGKCAGPGELATADWKFLPDWTVMFYMANDVRQRPLAEAFDLDEQEVVEGIGGNAKMRVVVQRDYAAPSGFAGRDTPPRPSERFTVYTQERWTSRGAGYPQAGYNDELVLLRPEKGVTELGETDTTDWTVLRDFVVDSIHRFPAKHYYLVITGHGEAWQGLLSDEHPGEDGDGPPRKWMPLSGLSQALQQANAAIAAQRGHDHVDPELQAEHLSRRLDIVQFDACLMGSLEVMVQMGASPTYPGLDQLSDDDRSPLLEKLVGGHAPPLGLSDYVVASQAIVPNGGHPYHSIASVAGLAGDDSEAQVDQIVRRIIEEFVRSYVPGLQRKKEEDYKGKTVTAVAINLKNTHVSLEALGGQSVAGEVSIGQVLLDLIDALAAVNDGEGLSCRQVHALGVAVQEQARVIRGEAVAESWCETLAAAGDATPSTASQAQSCEAQGPTAELAALANQGNDTGRAGLATRNGIDLLGLLQVLRDPPEWLSDSLKAPAIKAAADAAWAVVGLRDRRPLHERIREGGWIYDTEFNPQGPFVAAGSNLQQAKDGEDTITYYRTSGLSVLWGDPSGLLFARGPGQLAPLDQYRRLVLGQPLEEGGALEWQRVFGRCIAETDDCIKDGGQGERCALLPNWRSDSISTDGVN